MPLLARAVPFVPAISDNRGDIPAVFAIVADLNQRIGSLLLSLSLRSRNHLFRFAGLLTRLRSEHLLERLFWRQGSERQPLLVVAQLRSFGHLRLGSGCDLCWRIQSRLSGNIQIKRTDEDVCDAN